MKAKVKIECIKWIGFSRIGRGRVVDLARGGLHPPRLLHHGQDRERNDYLFKN